MGFVDSFISSVEDIGAFIANIFGTNLSKFVMLETMDSENILLAQDGSMVSGIRIDGFTSTVGDEEFAKIKAVLAESLKSHLLTPGHMLQFWFYVDPDATRETLEDIVRGSRATAKQIGLETQELTDYKIRHLAKYCATEYLYLGIWTTHAKLDKTQAKANADEIKKDRPPREYPLRGQGLAAINNRLRDVHLGFVRQIISDLAGVNISCELLDSHEICRVARLSIAPDNTRNNWRPRLCGDVVPAVERSMGRKTQAVELQDLYYPPIYEQIFPDDAERIDTRYISLGNLTFAPLYIEIPPSNPKRFSWLFSRLKEANIPWSASFLIEGGPLNGTFAAKGEISGLLSWASGHNRQIFEAYQQLKEKALDEPVIKLKMTFCTWSPREKLDLLKERAAKLVRAIEGWGQCEVRTVSGDPMQGLISSSCFLSNQSIATAAYTTIDDALTMFPIDRSASPWRTGSVIFRTRDGKIMPFEPGSSIQTTWNYLVFGSPGFGKSVIASTILMAVCQQSGIMRLPRIAITDIGPSSAGFIDAIKDMLPSHQKHLVARFRLQMNREFSVNPFDTHLGLDKPLPDDKSFLVSLVTLLATPPESGEAYDSISAMASKVIDIMYENVSRGKNPKRYGRNICAEVDAALDAIGFVPQRNTSWWDVVDYLYERGKIHEAYLAQRYAVPTLDDAVAAANHKTVKDLYGEVHIKTGEPLYMAFSRLIQDAMRDYPIMTVPTVFDIGDARIVSIDIDEVAKRGSPSMDKQTAVMYMLASYIMTKNWRLSNDPGTIRAIPEMYRDYHIKRIQEIQEDMKWDVADEFHRASQVAAAQPVIHDYIVRMREGRKWNRGVFLLSQSIDDYPDEMLDFVTGVFALEGGIQKTADRLQKIFGFNDSAKKMLMTYANGPAKDGSGSPFLGIFKTKNGIFTQFMVNSISPVEIWSYSTTTEDRLIRDAVFAKLGSEKGRIALAEAYPTGSAKSAVERLRAEFANASDSEKEVGPIRIITQEIIDSYMRKHG